MAHFEVCYEIPEKIPLTSASREIGCANHCAHRAEAH